FALGFYHMIFEADLIERSGDPTMADLVVATLVTVLVFEAARRVVGWALTLVCLTFLAYGFFGQYLPGDLAHRGFGFDQIVDQLYLGSDGILGTPILVSATYIFLFILFGTFLEHAGMIRLFNALALGLVGRAQGGPAKVAVISSGLMGTISGSGVANVLTVGQFTIPLMKKFGYSSIFSGAVEATSSMGGQIMPPVMGAVAFIMAETLNVPYADIVKAAVIPASLYYATAFWMVHLEAGRLKLMGVPEDECPNVWLSLKENWHLALPLVVLVYMLFHGFTPMFAGMMGLTLTSMLILGTALAARISMTAFRYVFWFALGLSAASFSQWGIKPVVGVIALLVVANYFVKGGGTTLNTMKMAMINGAKQALGVGIACAIVGVIVGILTLTGAASSFAGYILEIGQTSLFLSLFLTMLACLLLGMGIPTIPNYIITSSIAAPALLKLGVPLIVSHMFVFYFGIMADLTPPVALAAFAAASIAKAPAMKIGFKATQIAIAGFIVPFMAVYDPALMLQGDPTVIAVIYIVFKALLAIFLWGGAAIGYLWSPLSTLQRGLGVIAAIALVAALPISDQIGFALSLTFILWVWLSSRKK
ncbi:MAG: TRAP transporter permease, partial [Sulfurospirillaceae bacterium]|nr:TRAP transporter permease [Sulfurospirillaceae bacterium]